MKIMATALSRALALALLLFLFAGPVLAQFSHVEGEVLDKDGKPYPGVGITFKNKESGQTLDTKTDAKGQFSMNGLRLGVWTISVKLKDQKGQEQTVHERDIRVTMSGMEKVSINFKELLAKASAEDVAARKKQEEEAAKFAGLKAHFDAGRAQLEAAIATKNEIQKTSAAERGPLTEKLTQSSEAAIKEFEAAKASATDADPNMHIVMYNLAQAYDVAGKYDDAVAAYAKAIELKGDIPGYYLAYGTALAKAGKVTEAMATCEKSAKLTPTTGGADVTQTSASCYGNIGITLMNAAKMKDGIEPFKKATEIAPKTPIYWIYLGRCLLNAMDYKMEGGQMKMVPQPGTEEAFQKYLELAPDGPYAEEAKGGLTALGASISTKYSTKKPAKKP